MGCECKRHSYINTPSALHPLCKHPAVLRVEVGCVVANRGVARQRNVVRMRAMRAHSRRRLPKIRPKASSSTGQHGRSWTSTSGERTHLGGGDTQSAVDKLYKIHIYLYSTLTTDCLKASVQNTHTTTGEYKD